MAAKKKRKANPRISKKKKRKLPVRRAPKKQSRKKKKLPKKRRSRSQASKRGWVTRRQNIAAEQRNKKKALKRQLIEHPELAAIDDLIRQAKREGKAEARAEMKAELRSMLKEEQLEKELVKAQLRKTRQQVVDYMALRGDEYDKDVFESLGFVESDETQILARLRFAEEEGLFDETANQLANEFGWSIREIYTLFFSP